MNLHKILLIFIDVSFFICSRLEVLFFAVILDDQVFAAQTLLECSSERLVVISSVALSRKVVNDDEVDFLLDSVFGRLEEERLISLENIIRSVKDQNIKLLTERK